MTATADLIAAAAVLVTECDVHNSQGHNAALRAVASALSALAGVVANGSEVVGRVNLASGGAAVAPPTNTMTWVDGGAHGNVTLANGTADGQRVTISTTFIADGVMTITPANGPVATITVGKAGVVQGRWDATHTTWVWVSLVNATQP